MANAKENWRAVAPPQVTDDSSQGYSIGSTWYNQSTGVLWVCQDATVGAAKWSPFTAYADAWSTQTYKYPANFGGGFEDHTPAMADAMYLFPFIITGTVKSIGLALKTVGSSGAEATLAIYPNNPLTGKPDGQARIGGTSGTINLAAGSTPLAKEIAAINKSLAPGLYWVGVSLKSVGTMPVLKGMKEANGLFVGDGSAAAVFANTANQCWYSAITYSSGVSASPCPVTTLSPASPAPFPLLKSI